VRMHRIVYTRAHPAQKQWCCPRFTLGRIQKPDKGIITASYSKWHSIISRKYGIVNGTFSLTDRKAQIFRPYSSFIVNVVYTEVKVYAFVMLRYMKAQSCQTVLSVMVENSFYAQAEGTQTEPSVQNTDIGNILRILQQNPTLYQALLQTAVQSAMDASCSMVANV